MGQCDRLFDVLDLAYQAALEPELWSQVLLGVAECVEAPRALLLYQEPGCVDAARFSARADEPLADDYFSKYEIINPIQERLNQMGKAVPTALTDQDVVPKSTLLNSDFYGDFLRPTQMQAFLLLPLGAPYSATVNVIRGPGADEFDRQEVELGMRIQRSLTGAWILGERLGLRRSVDQSLADVIDRLPSAVMVVRGDGRIAHANAAARSLLAAPDGLSAPAGILEASALESRQRLRRLIGQATNPDADQRSGGAMAVTRPSGLRPLAVLVAPARTETMLLFSDAPLALVSVSDPEAVNAAPVERLRTFFGFTPAEARVAAEFVAGHDPSAIADHLGLSVNTVRIHVLRIRAKTGASRQGEFIALVQRTLGAGWSNDV